jgi:hypothetical protein
MKRSRGVGEKRNEKRKYELQSSGLVVIFLHERNTLWGRCYINLPSSERKE